MGQQAQAKQTDRKEAPLSDLPEETHVLVQEALRCFSLVQVLNGAIASLVTLAGYLYKQTSLTGDVASVTLCLVSIMLLHSHEGTVTQLRVLWCKTATASIIADCHTIRANSSALLAHYTSVRYSRSASTSMESAEVCISWASWCGQPQGELCFAVLCAEIATALIQQCSQAAPPVPPSLGTCNCRP